MCGSFYRWIFIHNSNLGQRQNGRHFADDIFKCIFMNENIWIPIQISLKFIPKGPINNILALVQVMAWRRAGDKPLSEPMMVSLPTHICVTRPQWVNKRWPLKQNFSDVMNEKQNWKFNSQWKLTQEMGSGQVFSLQISRHWQQSNIQLNYAVEYLTFV